MTLAEREERQRPPLARSGPHHALVHVYDGDIIKALRNLKRQVDDSGLRRLLRPNGRLQAYQPPSTRRRVKRAAARARARKQAQKGAWQEMG